MFRRISSLAPRELTLSGTLLVPILLLLPETTLRVVGNGPVPVTALRWPLFCLISTLSLRRKQGQFERSTVEIQPSKQAVTREKRKFSSPLASLKVLTARDGLAIVSIFRASSTRALAASWHQRHLFLLTHTECLGLRLGLSIFYLVWAPFLERLTPASISPARRSSLACRVSNESLMFCIGYVLRFGYRMVAKQYGVAVAGRHVHDTFNFSFKLRSAVITVCATGLSTVGCRWVQGRER